MILPGRKYLLITIAALCAAAFAGCSRGRDSVSAVVDPRGWKQEDIKTLVYNNSDTTSLRSIVVFVSGDRYMEPGIHLEITTVTPDSLRFTEKFLFEPSSEENGGDFTVRRAVYRNGSLFSREGGYVFRIRQLGSEPLEGIRAVGIEIASDRISSKEGTKGT